MWTATASATSSTGIRLRRPAAELPDLGRGRNGWYLTSLTDPFGNGITLDYYSGLGGSSLLDNHCPTATNS
jgi:hypothetical protein